MSADGTDLPDNKCFDVTLSYGQCEASCPGANVKLSNGANWRCTQDAIDQAKWHDSPYFKDILGDNSEPCKYDNSVQCTTLEKLKGNVAVEGGARATATGFCNGPEIDELVDWFFKCDIYPYDKELSLLEYARCMKAPDCPAEPAEPEGAQAGEGAGAEAGQGDPSAQEAEGRSAAKEDGEPFFTSDEILEMFRAGYSFDEIKQLEQMG